MEAKFKKTGHVTLTTPIEGLSVIPMLAFDVFYQHTNLRTLASAVPEI